MSNLDNVFSSFDNPNEAWNSYKARRAVADAEMEWIRGIKKWRSVTTLTFRNELPDDIATKRLKRLIREMNKRLIGSHYTRVVGHSYFSYVVGIEYQERGVIHFHLLVDKPIDFTFVHGYWEDVAGFAWIDLIKDLDKSVNYVTKYIVKGGEVDHYLAKVDFYPKQKPLWWID